MKEQRDITIQLLDRYLETGKREDWHNVEVAAEYTREGLSVEEIREATAKDGRG